MSSEQADQLKLGAEMIKRASRITGYDVTAFRIGKSKNPVLHFHTAALHEAMIQRDISYMNRLELLRVNVRQPHSKDPFFLGLVTFYAETSMPSH